MLYVTPEKFKTGGWGVDLEDIEDVELRSILTRATNEVNAYCCVPEGHDFRGGTVVGEQAEWHFGFGFSEPRRRYHPLHKPIRSVEDMRIHVSDTQYVGFTAANLWRDPAYVEIVAHAFSSVGLFGGGLLPSLGLVNPQLKIDYTYGYSIPVLNEELEPTDAKTFRAQNQWWDSEVDPEVRKDGVVVTTGYTVDYDEGTVTFDSTTATTRVHVDYYHRLPSNIAEATGMVATELLGDRGLTAAGLHGLVELAVGEIRIRRDFPRAGVQKVGISDKARQLLDPYVFITARGGAF